MESLEQARAIYSEVVDGQSTTAGEIARELQVCADEVRLGTAEVLESDASGESEEVARYLEQAGNDLRSVLTKGDPTIKELPSGVAGQAQLDSNMIEIDPHSIQSDSGRIIDKKVAENVRDHEIEHTKQSANADASGIEVNGNKFNERQIREAAAISVQTETSFLSSEYKQIMASFPMDAVDRVLVREGKFRDLEKKKNGSEFAQAA
ncbi:hypothetical protein KKF55_03440 [Patescibacteria group bacterium]|nr:hypothetical protein [Patescibacteria group bacterium]